MSATRTITIETNAAIPTWFGIGGRARRLAKPQSIADLKACLDIDPNLKILGDGANLLVDDDGISDLVVTLNAPAFTSVHRNDGLITAGAGANLPKLITSTVREGLAGLEGLGGIPATIGGATIMNAGGTFGQFADSVARVHALDRQGHEVVLDRGSIPFSYRHSGLSGLIITSVELDLKPAHPAALREFLKDVMARKKATQPLAEKSAGCVFKNPTLTSAIKDIADAGVRVSAGMLIDRAGCKGMTVGGAEVSRSHANFITTHESAKARDVINLMDQVKRRVLDTWGVTLEPEVAIWKNNP
jgi:UDP-N-acetylmuramate dehydrogenase